MEVVIVLAIIVILVLMKIVWSMIKSAPVLDEEETRRFLDGSAAVREKAKEVSREYRIFMNGGKMS